MSVPSDWWKDFFSGVVVEFWTRIAAEGATREEVCFIEKELGLYPPARILDVPCGNGRHAVELARRGYRMAGVDLSPEFVDRALAQTAGHGVAVDWEQRDMRDLPWQDEFDGAFSFGNSFGYLDDDGNREFLLAVGRALKRGARLLLDVPMLAEAILPKLEERTWYPAGDIFFLIEQQYDPVQARVEAEYTFIQGGKVEKHSGSHRVYTYRELVHLLEEAGFGDVTAYGSTNGEPLKLGSQRPVVLAVKK